MQFPRSLVLTAALVALPGIASAESDHPYCGTTHHLHEVVTARSDAQMRRVARQLGVTKAALEAHAADVTVRREGEIAVLQSDETLVTPANPFDLSGRAIRFMRRGEGFSVGREKPGFARPIGNRIDLNAFDSRWVDFGHGATFPFGDEVHTGMWINSSGNLTFADRDRNPTLSLEALVGGQPRIAPLMQTFRPRGAPGKGGIYYWVDRQTREIRVTWFKVPLLRSRDTVSFQVRLRPDGRITFAYDQVPPSDGIVGIFPPSAGVRVLDLRSELPAPPASGAVAEQFYLTPELNHVGLSRAFLEHFEDRYDFVSMWFDFPLNVGFFFHVGVRNDVQGIGRGVFDRAESWGSGPGGQMKSYLFMNSLDFIPDDPDGSFREDSPRSAIEILGHEVGHRWSSFTRFLDSRTGEESDALLGRQLAHWNFNLHTDGSVLGGNSIADNGDGTFTTVDAWTGYSELELYLMGFQPPSSVSPFFFVEGPDNPPRESGSAIGVELSGERVDVTLDDIVAVEGERVPASDAAPREFRIAFVLVTKPGEEPKEGSLDKLDTYRTRWEQWWAEITGASFDTTLEDPLQ